jgi:hypothetical protein
VLGATQAEVADTDRADDRHRDEAAAHETADKHDERPHRHRLRTSINVAEEERNTEAVRAARW